MYSSWFKVFSLCSLFLSGGLDRRNGIQGLSLRLVDSVVDCGGNQ
jgi:hypothetical protein